MKKIVSLFVFTIVFIAVVLFFAGNLIFSGSLSYLLGVPVHASRVHLGLSEAGIYGLEIGNPKGFAEKDLTSIPELSMQYDLSAILSGKVHVKKIKIAMAETTVEKNSTGKFNLLEMKVMKKPEGKKEAPAETQPNKPQEIPKQEGSKKTMPSFTVQIDELALDLDRVRYVDSSKNPPSVKEFPLGVRNQSFKDVTDATGMVKQIVFFILKKVGMSSLTSNLDVLLKGVGGDVGDKLGKFLNKLNNI